MEQLDLARIIGRISPLYNSYKKSNRDIDGADALCIMWEIGDILKGVIEASGLLPHNLYRKIYGKSEGANDIVQKSYITREFLGRAYRIRNIFKNKKEIEKDFPNLKSFILFREAMPFFDNKSYVLVGKEREKLLSILNSTESSKSILFKVKELQAEKIGIKNPRNQKLNELEKEKGVFIALYNYLYNLIKKSDYVSVKKSISPIDDFTLVCLSSATSCLAQEGLKYPEIPEGDFDQMWNEYISMIRRFSEQRDPKERRRFRRLIPLSRIVKLAEMLQAVTSNESYINFKKEH